MNGMDFLTGPMAQALGWALLHLLWQGAIVAGILAATLGLLAKQSANVRYAAACAALVLMLVLGVATAYRAYEPLAASTPQQSVTSFFDATDTGATTDVAAAPAAPAWRTRLAQVTLSARAWLPQIVLAWIVGVALLSVRLLLTLRRAHQLAQRDTVVAGEEWQLAVQKLAEALRLKRTVKLLESAAVDVPTVIGWMRPVVLLPASTLVGLSPTQLEMILAHELAHIRRHDFFVNLLQAVVETLMFYHPAVWWMSRQVRIERENCCDDLAVSVCGNAIQYARALARLEELRMTPMQATLAANGGSLLDRVRRLVGARAESTISAPRWAAGLAVLSILLLVVAAPALPALEKKNAKAKEAGSHIDVAASLDDDSDDPKAVSVASREDEEDEDDPDYDFDFDSDDDYPPTPVVAAMPPYPPYPPGTPAPAAMPAPMVAPTPMVAPVPFAPATPLPPRVAARIASAVAPRAAAAAIAGMDFDFDFEFDGDDDTPKADTDKAKSKRRGNRKVGEGDLSVDELIAFRIHGITPQYISQMRGIFPDLTVDQVTAMKIHGLTPDYVTEMKSAGLGTLDAGDFISFKIHGITPAYITTMRNAGIGTLSKKEILSLKIHDVSPDYVKEARRNFGSNIDLDEILSFKIHDLTPSYMAEMRGAGLGNISTKDLLSMRIHDVDVRYVQSLRDAGVKIDDARDVTALKIHDVTPEFVKQLSRAGYTNLSARELARLAAAGVNEDFIQDMAKYRVKN